MCGRCDDVASTSSGSTFLSISCAIVEYDKLTPASDIPDPNGMLNNHSMPVIFQVDTTRNYMKCAQTKISLESIRWPRRRFTSVPSSSSSTASLLNMMQGSNSYSSSLLVDAALWVQPFCGADDRPLEVCLEAFTKAACFPYCMALRQSGSYNSILRLYNAPDWLNSVHLFNRDCAMSTGNAQTNLPTLETIRMASTGYTLLDTTVQAASKLGISTTLSNDWSGASVQYPSNAISSLNCVHNALVTSIVPKSTLSESVGDYGSTFFGSTLASGQPFVYAGDTILTAECDNAVLQTPTCVVHVHRIYANEDGQYTLVPTNLKLPAMGISTVPAEAYTVYPTSMLRIPYSYTTNPWTHNPATATENAIFYAVNPYWQLFQGFIQYCNNPTLEGSLQLSPTSSFYNITVFRVFAYTYCTPSQEAGCYEGLSSGVKIPSSRRPYFDVADCYETIDLYVSSMEYLDTENVAVNVVQARLADTDPLTLKPSNFSTATYFLNTITMQVSLYYILGKPIQLLHK